MVAYIAAYAATALVFFGLDFIWLSVVARNFYVERLGSLLLEKPLIVPAALFYSVYVIGIVIFAVAPAMRSGSATTALLFGALFGFFAYATYDMTNYSTLRNWPLLVTVVDIAWGTVLTGVAAWLGFLAVRALMPDIG